MHLLEHSVPEVLISQNMSGHLTRRQFLRRTSPLLALAGIGLPPVKQTSAQSPSPAPSSPDKIRCACIGVGGRGTYLMGLLMEESDAHIVAICDVNEQNRGRAGIMIREKQNHSPKQFGDFRRLLDDASVEACIVATPHHWHAPIVVRALEAGKHVYVEKPASHVFREGRVIADAARKHGRIVQHGTQMRSSEVTAAAADVLKSGILGEIKMSKAWGVEPRQNHPQPMADGMPPAWLDYETWLGPAPKRLYNRNRVLNWNSFRDYGNGEIGGDGIHDIDLARWGLAVSTHPIRITAHGSSIHVKGESDFPDNMIVTYQYAEGKVLIYENRNFAPYKTHGWDNGNIFYGTTGYMIFSRRGYFQTYLGEKEEKGPGMRGGAGNKENIRDFLEAIRRGKPNSADALTAHLSCGLVHLGEVAYRTQKVIEFDPAKEIITNDPEADAMLGKSYRGPWKI